MSFVSTKSEFNFKNTGKDRFVWTGICLILAGLALFAPAWSGHTREALGSLLIWIGIIEIFDAFKRMERHAVISARTSGALSLLMGMLLINALLFQREALYVFVISVFVIDSARYFYNFYKARKNKTFFGFDLGAGIGNVVLVVMLLISEDQGTAWVLSIAVALRITGIGLYLLWAKTGVLALVHEDVLASFGLTDNVYVKDLAEKVRIEEERSARVDQRWIIMFIVLLFFIHLGRMGMDRSALGILSPVVATLGDVVIAIIITYAILAPIRLMMLRFMKNRGSRVWTWITKIRKEERKKISVRTIAEFWLTTRMRAEMRFKKAGYSLPTAVRIGLKLGLPWSALLAAVMPVLGMSWYFDTENWASGIWDKWAAARADEWRMAITKNSGEGFGANAFRLYPQGVN